MTVRVRVVGDLHVGSYYSLWPPRFSYDGQPYPQNQGQRWLWQRWVQGWTEKPRPDVLVIAGDILEGPQRKVGGLGTHSPDLDMQQLAALEVMRPALERRPGELYVLHGTPYHEPHRLSTLALLIGAKTFPRTATPVGLEAFLQVGTKHILIRHHPDSGATLYQASGMERQVLWSLMRAAAQYDARYDCLVVAHRHVLAVLRVYRTLVVAVPAWKLMDDRSRSRRRHTWIPDLGWMDLLVDDNDIGVHPYEVRISVASEPIVVGVASQEKRGGD